MANAVTDRASRIAEMMKQLKSVQLNAASDFRYQRLDASKREIRLVELLPQDQDHEVFFTCLIGQVFLDQTPPYTALSYIWGDISNTATIRLDNYDCFVFQNLLVALEHLQKKESVTL